MDLQAVELDRAIALLRTLGPDHWATQTVCPDWDVRQMWLHVLGACEAGASMRENMHQMLAARKRCKQLGVPLEAGLSGVQVAEREALSPAQLIERLEQIAPKTIKDAAAHRGRCERSRWVSTPPSSRSGHSAT